MIKKPTKNILIIDDNSENIKLASMILKKEGYSVFSGLSVDDGLKILRKTSISLILMDIMMPFVDGIAGVKIIKKDKKLKCIPILMLTAVSDMDNVLNAINAGADDYLVKPYNIKDFTTKVKNLSNISMFIQRWCNCNE
jgi:DNA-binding response OmpR family regulator